MSVVVAVGICAAAAVAQPQPQPDRRGEFWLGADISGTTADEARGRRTLNAAGDTVETTRLMRDYGMDAVRLRVWVEPADGFCSPRDVLRLALRAKALDMPVMVDFHYSDWWADPGKQNIPAAWRGLDYGAMKDSLAAHTRSTLRLLRDAGVDVRWVQVGNETTNGFLWDMGRAPEHMEQYAGLTTAGYDAVKEVYPDAQVIVHLDNGFDRELYDCMFDGLAAAGGKWDTIGMSVYPYWAVEGGREPDAASTLRDALANIRHLKRKYGCDVMIAETGVDAGRPAEGKEFMDALIRGAMEETDGACTGVFYWAPEANAEDAYKLGAFSHDRPTAIMDAFSDAARRRAAAGRGPCGEVR